MLFQNTSAQQMFFKCFEGLFFFCISRRVFMVLISIRIFKLFFRKWIKAFLKKCFRVYFCASFILLFKGSPNPER